MSRVLQHQFFTLSSRLIVTYIVIATVLSYVSSDNVLQRSVGLSLSEVNAVLHSEINEEFGYEFFSEEEINQQWEEAVLYEWNHLKEQQNGNEDKTRGLRSFNLPSSLVDTDISSSDLNTRKEITDNSESALPYLCCCVKNMTQGERCMDQIIQHFGTKKVALHNSDDQVCVIVSSTASNAVAGQQFFSLLPLLPEMKLVKGTVENIERNPNTVHQINVMLCPAFQYEEDEEKSEDIINSLLENSNALTQREGLHRFLRLDRNLFNAERKHSLYKNTNHHRSMLWSRVLEDNSECNLNQKTIKTAIEDNGIFASLILLTNPNQYKKDSPTSSSSCLLQLVSYLSIQPQVCSVSIEPEISFLNEEVQWIIQSGRENKRPWFDSNIDGSGQVVGLSDSGLDVENCYFQDNSMSNFQKDGNVFSEQRKVVQYHPHADDSDLTNGHGTHVAGTIAGFRQMKNWMDPDSQADGIAKGAKLAFFDVANSEGGVHMPNDPSDIFKKNNEANAFLHSISWGSPGSFYMHDEASIDAYLYKYPDNFVCAAAGNFGREGEMNLASPGTAKNVLSVGSTYSKDSKYLSSVTDFSSRGPTVDGRMKPEIMAPGDSILSACANPKIPGVCDDNGGLKYAGGTSMSAPAACGAAAIIRQYFEDGIYRQNTGDVDFQNPPSGPLIKAVLINGATTLTTNHNMDPIPPYDNSQGFGLINLVDSMPLVRKSEMKAKVIDRREIKSNSMDEYVVNIDASNNCDLPLSVSLVWYDPPAGLGCTRCLLNDLNLFITSGLKTHYPNGYESEKDKANNSERVQISVQDGEMLGVHVEATDLVTEVQMYALVITGCLGEVQSEIDMKDSTDVLKESPYLVTW